MANYNSTYSGQEVDNAVGRALPDGTLDVDIRGKQDKLSQTQINAVNSGINATKVAKYDGYEQEIDNKQDNLPDIVNDRYLHTNALTGELEWKVGVSKGTDDYNDLTNKPTINGEEIIGDVSLEDLNVQEQLTQEQLDAVNSEVTSEWKNTIDGDITSLEVGKQDKLTSQQISNINRALVSPIASSTEKRIVAVDENNNQVQVKVGEGLQIEGSTSPFTLKASGSGGGASWGNITGTLDNQADLKTALDGKVEKQTPIVGLTCVYALKPDGTTDKLSTAHSPSVGASLPRFDSGYRLATNPPINDNHCANKKYVDDAVAQATGGWTLLWENASPDSNFTSQTLSIDSTNYNKLVIEILNDDTYIVDKEFSTFVRCNFFSNDDSDSVDVYNRMISSITNSQLVVGNCTHTIIDVDAITKSTTNYTLKPIRIYGFN